MRKFIGFESGVNLGGWLSQCDHTKLRYDTFIGEQDIQIISNWGMDHVRVPIDYELIQKDNGDFIEEGFTYIDRCIEWCKKYHLKINYNNNESAFYDVRLKIIYRKKLKELLDS